MALPRGRNGDSVTGQLWLLQHGVWGNRAPLEGESYSGDTVSWGHSLAMWNVLSEDLGRLLTTEGARAEMVSSGMFWGGEN